MLSVGSRLLVAVVFLVLAVAFVATTVSLLVEFGGAGLDWFLLASFYGHLFVFFPTFGLLALCAFYIPACIFVDFYWKHVAMGRPRFVAGTLALALLAVFVAQQFMSGDVPALWWLRPATLADDRGSPAGCKFKEAQCKRAPVLESVQAIREVSQQRKGLSPFIRDCKLDPWVEPSAERALKRFCFPSMTHETAAMCCQAQQQFTNDLTAMYKAERGHSMTAVVHALTLPFKVFFLLVVLAIGVLLAIWRRGIDQHYKAYATRIERGILIGATAMLAWPVTNHAFLQAATALYGTKGEGDYATMAPLFSFIFGGWALLLLMFFFRQNERDLEAAGKIFGGVASVIAVMKYDQIIDGSVRFVGAGADVFEMSVLCGLIVVAFFGLVYFAYVPERPKVATVAPVPPVMPVPPDAASPPSETTAG